MRRTVLEPGLAERQVSIVPAVECGAGNAKFIQRALGWQMRLFNEPDDLQLLKMQDTSFDIFPIPEHAFFEEAEFQRLLGNDLLEIACLTGQVFHLVGMGC